MSSQAKIQTVIVVGAGASKEANLPTGNELKAEISPLLDIKFHNGFERSSGDGLICEALRHVAHSGDSQVRDVNTYLHACWHISAAMPQAPSIDNFIDINHGDELIELCGKLGIVRAILQAERESSLYVDQHNSYNTMDFGALSETWYNRFFQQLTLNCSANKLDERLSSIVLIIFNYDRCVEYYLARALANYYDMQVQRASELVSNMAIYHPYGSVGPLPEHGKQNAMPFGGSPQPRQLLESASTIKTFTEGTDPSSSEISAIRRSIADASTVVFLGFAFHKLNLELLTPSKKSQVAATAAYYATAFGISESDCAEIRTSLTKLAGVKKESIHLRSKLTCNQLFYEYSRALSLA